MTVVKEFVEGLVQIPGCHGFGMIIRREGVGGFCDFKDEPRKGRTMLQFGKELHLKSDPLSSRLAPDAKTMMSSWYRGERVTNLSRPGLQGHRRRGGLWSRDRSS